MNGHGVALWGALAAFFGNLIALKLLDLITAGGVRDGLAALVTSICVAGAVYARERLNDEKAAREAKRDRPP